MSFHKRPPADELVAALESLRHIAAVARQFKASRKAVYEWIDYYVERGAIKHDCKWSLITAETA